MIKIMLKPFFKKFFGLFISMVFVSALSIAMLSAFASTITNLSDTCKGYLKEYQNIDGMFKTQIVERSNIDNISNVEGVERVGFRLSIDAKMQKEDGRTITSRIFTYVEGETAGNFKPYVIDSIEEKDNIVNIGVVRKFAENNNIKLGDTIKVGYFKTFVNLYVNEIVETPEGVQARANEYVWSDSSDFGYLYVEEKELDKVLSNIAKQIDKKISESSEYKEYYERAKELAGFDVDKLIQEYIEGKNQLSKYANQILITAKEGYTESEVVENVKKYLEARNVVIKQSSEAHKLFYVLFLENCIKQVRVASVFLPVFFYAVTMIVIGLFMNQIIKSMTQEIGIMTSIGVDFRSIQAIYLIFTLLMSVASSIVGLGTGYLLNLKLSNTMRVVYSLPTIPNTLNWVFSLVACVGLLIFAEITTLISTRAILKITPKDATLNNETKRKPLPKGLAKFIEKAPMTIKLGVNSIAQNFRRFFVSTFSIFASFVIILLSLYFNVSKTELVNQSVNRRLNFDAQIYLTEVASEEAITALKNQEFVTAFENCYYTYMEATNDDKKMYLECLAYDPDTTLNLVQIPSKNGRKTQPLQKEGIVLPKSAAKELNVKVGDTITINGKDIKITAISNQYFHPMTYMSLKQMTEITDQYVSSFLVNTNNDKAMLDYLGDEMVSSLAVFTSNLGKDINGVFGSINVFIYIMIGFSLGMAFIILAIMGQNTLMDQKRQLTIFRAIGFTIKNISDLWTIQSISHLILSTFIAVPVGIGTSMILFSLCSSANQTYPFIFSIGSTAFAFLFILLIIIATHLISMFSIKKWNIADITRSRE